MKKIKLMLILIMCIFVSNLKVYAASATLSVSSQNVSVGDKFTVYVKVNSAAAWNIHAIASGVVGKCELNQVDTTADALDTSKTFSTICTATEEGIINITLSGDVTSASDGVAVNVSDNKAIKVNKKVVNNNTNNNVNKKSDNNKLKELSIENYEVKKIDNNNYELVVNKGIDSVNVKAMPEDNKAKIDGTGVHNLSLGENKIELVVTSESGKENTVNIKVIRKDNYYLSDLPSLLDDPNMEKISVIIFNNDKLSLGIIDSIKKSKKIVNLDYYDEDNILLYTWELDGNKIGDISELELNVSFETDNINKILELSNYADGVIVNLPDNNLTTGVKIKLYVGDKYKNNEKLNIYRYILNEDKLSLEDDSLNVKDGYIEFEILDNNDYFITMSNGGSVNNDDCDKCSSPVLFIIISIIELLVVLILIFYILRLRNNKKNDIVNNEKIDNDMYNINNQNNNQSNDLGNNNLNDFSWNMVNNSNNITNVSSNNMNTNSSYIADVQNNNISGNVVNIPANNINSDVYNNQNGNINNNMF